MTYTLSNQSPSTGFIAWASVHIVFDGVDYAVTNGNTNKRFVYWVASTPTTLQVSDTYPALGANDAVIFINRDGVGLSVLEATVTDGSLVVPGTISAEAIAAGAISAAHIAAGAITTNKIAANTITAANIAAGTITATELAANSVTASQLSANAVTAGKIAAGAISATEIQAGAILASKLAIGDTTNLYPDPDMLDASLYSSAGSYVFLPNNFGASTNRIRITSSGGTVDKTVYGPVFTVQEQRHYSFGLKLGGESSQTYGGIAVAKVEWSSDGTFSTPLRTDVVAVGGTTSSNDAYEFQSVRLQAPLGAKKARLTFTRTAHATLTGLATFCDIVIKRAIDSELIVDGAVIASKIAANAVTADAVAAGAITATQIAANAVTTAKIAAGAITANEIAASTITAANIAANTITAAQIAANTITSANIAANTITAANIAAGTITATELAANSVTASQLSANAVTAGKIAAGAISATEIQAGAILASKLAIGDTTNLYPDPDMLDASLYSSETSFSFSSNGYGSSIRKLTISSSGGTIDKIVYGPAFPVESEAVYLFGIKLGTEGSGSYLGAAHAFVEWYSDNEATAVIGSEAIANGNSTAWRTVLQTVQILAPSGSKRARIVFKRTAHATSTINAVFNEVSIRRSADAKLIVDGAVIASKIAANAVTANAIAANSVTATQIAANAVTTAKIAAGAITANEIAASTITAANIAANTITAAQIAANTITSANIAANTITATELATGAVTAGKIATNAVTATEIAAGSITTAKIAAGAVTANEIAANSVIAGKVAAAAISTNELAANAVTTAKIAAGAVSATEIAANTITSANIAAGVITATELAASAVIAGKIATGAVTAGKIAANAVTATEIAANAVTTAKINAGAVTATEIAAGAITTTKIATGAVTATEIAASTITGAKIAANTITAANIAANTITASQIAANTITSANIAAGAVTAGKIATNAVTATEIAAGSITTAKIAAGAVTANEIAAGSIVTTKLAANAVTANELAVDAVTAGKIAAGAVSTTQLAAAAITSDKIAANAITARELAVGDFENYVQNPQFQDGTLSGWDAVTSGIVVVDKQTVTSVPAGAPTRYVMTIPARSSNSAAYGSVGSIACRPGDEFFLGVDTARSADTWAASAMRLMVYWTLDDGSLIDDALSFNVTTGWTRATARFVAPFQAVAVRFRIWRNGSSGSASVYLTNFELRRVNDGVLIKDGAITAAKILAGTITGDRLAANTITASQIAANTITASQIAAGTITGANIAAGTITASQIAASTITATNIAAGTITAAELAANSVTSAKIEAGSIVTGKIAAGAITTTELAASAVTAAKIAANTITAAQIAAGTITASQIAANTITATELAAGAVTAGKIATNAVTATEIAAGAITTAKIAAGAVDATKIQALSITSGQIAAGTITATNIAAGTITAAELAANSVTASQLSANAVTAGKIAAGAVSTSQLAAEAITAEKLAANVITAKQLVVMDLSNLFVNPSFEQGLDGWGTPTALLSYANTSHPYSTVPSAKFIQLDETGATADFGSGYIPVVPGEIYYLSFMYTCDANAVTNGAQRLARHISRTGSASPVTHSLPLSVGTWSRYEATVTIPANTVKTFFGIRRGTSQGSPAGAWYFTNFILRRRVSAELIVDGAITAGKIAAGAIVAADIAAGTITAANIAANTITASQIAANTITSANIAAGAVTAGKIATNAVTATEIAAGSITTAKIAAGAVTANEIAALTITAAKIATATITSTQIAADAITADKIAANAITSAALAANSVIAGKVAAAAISTNELAANAVTTAKIAANAVTANQIAIGDFTNLVPNSQFVGGDASNWDTLPAGAAIVEAALTPDCPLGNPTPHVLAISDSVKNTGPYAQQAYSPCRPNDQFYLAVDHAIGAGTWIASKVRLVVYFTRNGATTSSTSFYVEPGTVWAQSERTFTAPADCTGVRLRVYRDSSAGTAVAYFSNFQLRKMTDAVLIKDGAVTSPKIIAGAITTNKIAVGAITADTIAAGAITATKIASSVIGTDKLTITSPENLLPFSRFEGGEGKGWTSQNGWTITAGAASAFGSGYFARHVSTDTGSNRDLNQVDTISVVPGEPYLLEAWLKRVGTTSFTSLYLFIRWYDVADAQLGTDNIDLTSAALSTTYAVFGGARVAPANAAKARVFVRVSGHTAGSIDLGMISVSRQIGSIQSSNWNTVSKQGFSLDGRTGQIQGNQITVYDGAGNTVLDANGLAGTFKSTLISSVVQNIAQGTPGAVLFNLDQEDTWVDVCSQSVTVIEANGGGNNAVNVDAILNLKVNQVRTDAIGSDLGGTRGTGLKLSIRVLRGATIVYETPPQSVTGIGQSIGAVFGRVDTPPAGTHNYKVQAKWTRPAYSAGTITITYNSSLAQFEGVGTGTSFVENISPESYLKHSTNKYLYIQSVRDNSNLILRSDSDGPSGPIEPLSYDSDDATLRGSNLAYEIRAYNAALKLTLVDYYFKVTEYRN